MLQTLSDVRERVAGSTREHTTAGVNNPRQKTKGLYIGQSRGSRKGMCMWSRVQRTRSLLPRLCCRDRTPKAAGSGRCRTWTCTPESLRSTRRTRLTVLMVCTSSDTRVPPPESRAVQIHATETGILGRGASIQIFPSGTKKQPDREKVAQLQRCYMALKDTGQQPLSP